MNILRRLPLSRLLLACALVVALGAGAAAIAAALGTGPTPPPKPLANAVHDALAAPPPAGVSARIQLTNHLVEGASLASQSGDGGPSKTSPLLAGASGRLWIGSTGKLRLELQSASGDTQVYYDGQTVSVYDSSSNSLYRMQLPPGSGVDTRTPGAAAEHKLPTVEEIQKTITDLMGHANLSGATPSDVAGRPAYTVRISPSHDGGLVGGAELAFDAERGVPLRLALYSTSSSAPVLELTATEISYEAVPDSVFALSPPPGVTIHDIAAPSKPKGADASTGRSADKPVVGATAVQASLPFKLDAPTTLAGMARSEIRAIDVNSHPAALVTYGKGLGGLAVIESQDTGGAGSADGASGRSSSSPGASLPTVSIGGTNATELPTALGTLLEFKRAGVDYLVVGSVTPATAEAAARGL